MSGAKRAESRGGGASVYILVGRQLSWKHAPDVIPAGDAAMYTPPLVMLALMARHTLPLEDIAGSRTHK